MTTKTNKMTMTNQTTSLPSLGNQTNSSPTVMRAGWPGGNITGFFTSEASLAAKWLELLTQIAPSVKRSAIMFNPETAPGRGSYFLPTFETAAQALKVDLCYSI